MSFPCMDYSKGIDKVQVAEVITLEIDGQIVEVERLEDGTFRKPEYLAGQEREVIGERIRLGDNKSYGGDAIGWDGIGQRPITAPATDAARTWQGYGTALKPAHEPILCFRKPRTATYASTALTHGTGALWIDGARVGKTVETWPATRSYGTKGKKFDNYERQESETQSTGAPPAGRWPANILLDPEAAAILDQMSGELSSHGGTPVKASYSNKGVYNLGLKPATLEHPYRDKGGASRFFQTIAPDRFRYVAKASRRERNAGLEGMPIRDASVGDRRPSGSMSQRIHKDEGRPDTVSQNDHPCVKPLALTEYLARLIVPPVEYRNDARLLIPYGGSGSEACGAILAGWIHVDTIDNDPHYCEIAEKRLAYWSQQANKGSGLPLFEALEDERQLLAAD